MIKCLPQTMYSRELLANNYMYYSGNGRFPDNHFPGHETYSSVG